MNYTLNCRGRLVSLAEPQVMGILNVTDDSFYAGSRTATAESVARRTREIVEQGGSMIDVGACSTRPGSRPVSEQEEMDRLRMALPIVRREQPDAIVSVDTFRPDVARMVVEEFGADIINDVGYTAFPPSSLPAPDFSQTDMFRMVARLGVPYVLMASASDLRQTLLFFAENVQRLRDLGQKDIVLDPGFGFGKTVEQNYDLLRDMDRLLVMDLPLLVGVSRKSMIYKPLGVTPNEALTGTIALNTVSLMKGASILRVHDVREAVECVKLCAMMNQQR